MLGSSRPLHAFGFFVGLHFNIFRCIGLGIIEGCILG